LLRKRLADAQSATSEKRVRGQGAEDVSSNIGNTPVEGVSSTDSRIMSGNSIGSKIAGISSGITGAQSANSGNGKEGRMQKVHPVVIDNTPVKGVRSVSQAADVAAASPISANEIGAEKALVPTFQRSVSVSSSPTDKITVAATIPNGRTIHLPELMTSDVRLQAHIL
jgi:hypothetical protein